MPSELRPKQDASSLFKRPNYETQGNRLSFRDICGYATVLWPPVPDVVKRTLGLKAINCSFTDEFMHRNTRRSSRSKAVVTSAGSNVERTAGISSTSAQKNRERRRRTDRREFFSTAKEEIHFYRKLHWGENSHRCFATSPRGSAQISTTNGATLRLHKPPVCKLQGWKQSPVLPHPSVCSSDAPTLRVTLSHCVGTDT